jgi:hypothetical protein
MSSFGSYKARKGDSFYRVHQIHIMTISILSQLLKFSAILLMSSRERMNLKTLQLADYRKLALTRIPVYKSKNKFCKLYPYKKNTNIGIQTKTKNTDEGSYFHFLVYFEDVSI